MHSSRPHVRPLVTSTKSSTSPAPAVHTGADPAVPHAPNAPRTVVHFADLALIEPIQRALRDEGYDVPTPIQAGAIPNLLAGRDLLGCAQTGTGKTAAFALPIIQRLDSQRTALRPRHARSLVLVPTRELATQVAESFQAYGRHVRISVALVYGGVGQSPQVRALSRGVDVLVATPGRLLDLLQQRHVDLTTVEIFVLDEADQMLDFGFMRDIEKILRVLPKKRQNVFFSATMPPPIAKLADGILRDPAKVIVTPVASTVDTVEQRVHHVSRQEKSALLRRVLGASEVQRALVFVRTKRGADRVARQLHRDGLRADAIHGNKSQNARERTLESFRSGKTPVLVATDIAARGIDIDEISHVVNFDLPNVPEVYVHRIGRTARAGASGIAISLCDETERAYLRDIERLIRRRIQVAQGSEDRRASHAPRRDEPRSPAATPSHEPRGAARPEHSERSPERSERLPERSDRSSERGDRAAHRSEHSPRAGERPQQRSDRPSQHGGRGSHDRRSEHHRRPEQRGSHDSRGGQPREQRRDEPRGPEARPTHGPGRDQAHAPSGSEPRGGRPGRHSHRRPHGGSRPHGDSRRPTHAPRFDRAR